MVCSNGPEQRKETQLLPEPPRAEGGEVLCLLSSSFPTVHLSLYIPISRTELEACGQKSLENSVCRSQPPVIEQWRARMRSGSESKQANDWHSEEAKESNFFRSECHLKTWKVLVARCHCQFSMLMIMYIKPLAQSMVYGEPRLNLSSSSSSLSLLGLLKGLFIKW